jgi:hypothetical protein
MRLTSSPLPRSMPPGEGEVSPMTTDGSAGAANMGIFPAATARLGVRGAALSGTVESIIGDVTRVIGHASDALSLPARPSVAQEWRGERGCQLRSMQQTQAIFQIRR